MTGFFRDPAADSASETACSWRCSRTDPGDVPLRLWVAGCASGAGGYSLGISAPECEEERGRDPSIDSSPLTLASEREHGPAGL